MIKNLRIPLFLGLAAVFTFSAKTSECGPVSGNAPTLLPKPRFLTAKDKVPLDSLESPDVIVQGPDGAALDSKERITPPDSDVLEQLSAPDLFEGLRKTKDSETGIKHFYWHQSGDLGYCHFVDEEGNHWYGWTDTDGSFNWILSRGRRYWWRDSFASHWLYYDRGFWWRADGQSGGQAQACVAGEYYLCDRNGKVLSDMGQDGEGAIVSGPGKYRGDFKHSGQGGHGGGHGGGDENGHAPQSAAGNTQSGTQGNPQGNN